MPAIPPPMGPADQERLTQLGARLQAVRKRQKVSAAAAAEAAGMSRVTLHRIEQGLPNVTMGAWMAAASALGLDLQLLDRDAATPSGALPQRILLADYPELKKLAWQLPGVEELTPQQALDLYERNWRHVDRAALSMAEIALVHALTQTLGGGRLLV